MTITTKLEKLLNDIDAKCKPINDRNPTSVDDLGNIYKKKDHDKLILIHVTYKLYKCLLGAKSTINEAHKGLTATAIELHTLQEESKQTINDLLNKSKNIEENVAESDTETIIKEIRKNRAEIKALKKKS